jgi:hypothetical protein
MLPQRALFSTTGVTGAQYKNQHFIIGDPNKGLFALGWEQIKHPCGFRSAPEDTTQPRLWLFRASLCHHFSHPMTQVASKPRQSLPSPQVLVAVGSINVTAGGAGYTALPGVTISAPDVQGGTHSPGGGYHFWWCSRCRDGDCAWLWVTSTHLLLTFFWRSCCLLRCWSRVRSTAFLSPTQGQATQAINDHCQSFLPLLLVQQLQL